MSIGLVRSLGLATAFVLAPTLVLCTAAKAAENQFPVATEARVGGDTNQTRFVVDFSSKIDLHAFTLADPYRVVVDLPQVVFRLPPKTGDNGGGLIKAFRYGLMMTGGSRMVLDLRGPARIEHSFALDPVNGQPARLVLDLAASDREAFLRTIAAQNQVIAGAPKLTSTSLSQTTNDPRPLIVIDPGHGGIDTGTKSASGVMEKDIVLGFGLALRDKLEKTGRFRVVMTRSDDTFIPLGDRVKFARARGAALFISVHADYLSHREGDAQGASVYTLSERASDAEAEHLADAENRADVIAGVDLSVEPNDVADILIDLAQRETKSFSIKFAKTLIDDLRHATRLHQNPLKSAGFVVLKSPDVPSVLVELGYVSNAQDLKSLTSDAWRDKTSDSIVGAVDEFFQTRLAGGKASADRN